MDLASTIIAVSSPPGPSPRGLIRVAGPAAFALLKPRLPEVACTTRGASKTTFTIRQCPVPVSVLVMPGPASYTTDDIVEIQLPGAPVLLEGVVDDLIQQGVAQGLAVRRATAGEFTYRAWAHGRIGLDRAEAVAALIAARNDSELTAARHAVEGATGLVVGPCAESIAELLALVEAGIDFVDEEDVVAIAAGMLAERLKRVMSDLQDHLEGITAGAAPDSRPRVTLRGPANAGKSTLFNALLGRTRVVIDNVAGTTRDAIGEPLTYPDGFEVLLVDTPGDEDGDTAQAAAHQPAIDAQREADLVVWCAPCGDDARPPKDALWCATKADLGGTPDPLARPTCAHVPNSIAQVADDIRAHLDRRSHSPAADRVLLSTRQRMCVETAVSSLGSARTAVLGDDPHQAPSRPEEVAADMRAALDDLGAITGDIPPDDVLGRVFASFCVGK